MKRILIVSPHFPPTNAPDHQRVRMSLPYYAECGWQPTVLAVDAACVEAPLDPWLMATLPSEVPVHRVRAWPVAWTRRIGLGNIAYRSWFQLAAAGRRRLQKERFDLVYFSTTQFIATLLGARWWKRFGVPFVIDIQDPWRTDYYERPGSPRPPGGWKYRFARWQAARLEESAWRQAAGFISVNEEYLAQLRARYPWFTRRPAAVIPFGAPETDFAVVRDHPEIAPAFARVPGTIHVVSVGAIGPIMRRALECLFRGVRALRETEPALAARLRFDFVGTSYAPASLAVPSVRPLADEFGVGDLVCEQPIRVGYFTAIQTLLAADAIVIPGSDDPAYNPSKIGASFLALKPTLALAPGNSAFARMIRELSFATLAATDGPAHSVVRDFLRSLASPATAHPATPRDFARFSAMHTARARTVQQCALFDRAVATK
jgi:glycosyl transferase family 4